MEDGKGQRLHIWMSHDSCQWKLKWEPTSLVVNRLRHRMSTRAAVRWMCLRVAQFQKCESRSVKFSYIPLPTRILCFVPMEMRCKGAFELFSKNFTKGTPSGSHLWSHFIHHWPPGPSTVPGMRQELCTYLPKGGSTPFSSLAPSSPWVTMFCYSSKRPHLLHGPSMVTAALLVQTSLPLWTSWLYLTSIINPNPSVKSL